MTDAELNERVLLAMGWKRSGMGWWTSPNGSETHPAALPDFLNTEAEFVALLLWHAANGRHPMVRYSTVNGVSVWKASIADHEGMAFQYGEGDTPAKALAVATISVPVVEKDEEA